MIPHPGTIYASFPSSQTVKLQSGTGTIEVENGTFYLKAGGERIAVTLPGSRRMHHGDTVRFSVHKEFIQITPLISGSTSQHFGTSDVVSLSADDESPPPLPLSSAVQVSEAIIPGIYRFTDAEEALAFTGQQGNRELLEQLRKLIAQEGAINLRINLVETGTSKVFYLSATDLSRTITTLQQSFSSSLLSSLPVEVLQRLLIDRGSLRFPSLEQLDSLLRNFTAAIPGERAGSPDAQMNALVQWLHSALHTETPLPDIARLAPLSPASAMIADLNDALPLQTLFSRKTSPATETFAVESVLTGTTDDKAAFIEKIIHETGFTLEHLLASPSQSTGKTTSGHSIKSQLLSLLALSTSGESGSPAVQTQPAATGQSDPPGVTTTSSAVFKLQKEDSAETVPATYTMGISSGGSGGHPSSPAGKAAEQIITILRNIFSILQKDHVLSSPKAVSPAAGTDTQQVSPFPGTSSGPSGAVNKTASVSEFILDLPDSAAATRPKTVKVITEQFETVTTLLTSLRKSPEIISALSPEQYLQLEKLSETVQRLVFRLLHPETVDLKADPTPAGVPPQPADLTGSETGGTFPSLFRGTLDAIGKIIELLQMDSDNALSAKTGENTRPDIEGKQSPPPRPQAGTENQPPREGRIRQQIIQTLSTAINRLESLQLLARQIPTNEGLQQIIALPVKFGNQWTDVNIRLLRRKNRKNARQASRFTVFLDIAPKSLGAIHVLLEYQRKKQLQLSVEFERKATREWFSIHRKEIHNALSANGMKVGQLQLTLNRKNSPSRSQSAVKTGNKVIDIQV